MIRSHLGFTVILKHERFSHLSGKSFGLGLGAYHFSTNFVGFSLIRGSEWGEPGAKQCIGQTEPVKGSVYPGGRLPAEDALRSIIRGMKNPAFLLDITLLTQLRKDGHPSVYAGQGKALVDCSHWCLAGVPDSWNELLYAALFGEANRFLRS